MGINAKNVRTLKTPFPSNILYTDIACVIAEPKLTIPILEMYDVKTIKDAKVFSHEDYPGERIAIFRVKKSERDKWSDVFEYMEKHPPTEHYHETCDRLEQILDEVEEEMKK